MAGMTFTLSDTLYVTISVPLSAPPAEGFSDMAGMAFSFFSSGKVQPLIGYSIVRPVPPGEDGLMGALSGIALRDMEDPKADGSGINYVQNFTVTMNSHYSSGVPNRVGGWVGG